MKFQVPSINGQANRDFQKIITQARKNIFSCGFLHVYLNAIFQNKLIRILDPGPPDPSIIIVIIPYHTICNNCIS